MRTSLKLGLICIAALALRLVVLTFVQHPGIADPNHYYNLGLRLVEGHGLTIDYVWHYNNPPAALVHPDDYWMPLTAIIAAAPMALFGPGVTTALLPFALLGVALALLAYAAARQFGVSSSMSLFAAAAAAFLPELALYSMRSESVVPNGLFVGGCLLLLTHGLRTGRAWTLLASGVVAGLAYLTRSENMLLAALLPLVALLYAVWDRERLTPKLLWTFVGAALVVGPWLAYSASVSGNAATPGLTRLLFMTSFNDLYAYGRELTLDTLLASQTPAQIIGKRLFELAASLKVMYTSLDIFLPVALLGGLGLTLGERDRKRLLTMAPPLLYVLMLLAFYSFLAPYNSQGGSFKRAYVSLIPVLLPLAAYALDRVIPNVRLRAGAATLAVLFLAANAVEAMRADAGFVAAYMGRSQHVAEAVATLPDLTGDGEIVLMGQDPFMLRFVGLRSAIFPEGDLDTVFDVAARYGVDYLLLPADRTALNPFYTGETSDPRLERTLAVDGTEYVFYAVRQDAERTP